MNSIKCYYKLDNIQLTQISQINQDCATYYDPGLILKLYDEKQGAVENRLLTYLLQQDSLVIGYLTYSCNFNSIFIQRVAIREPYRHIGYGTQLLCRLIDDAIQHRLTIVTKVEGNDLASLKFFSYNGFKAIAIICEDVFEYYLMEWRKEDNVLFSCLR